jgi:hypothetical protein
MSVLRSVITGDSPFIPMRSSHLRPFQNTSAPQSIVKRWSCRGAKVLHCRSPRRARCRDRPRERNCSRAGPTSCGAYGAMTGLASASGRAAACHRSCAGNLCAAGASYTRRIVDPPRLKFQSLLFAGRANRADSGQLLRIGQEPLDASTRDTRQRCGRPVGPVEIEKRHPRRVELRAPLDEELPAW